MKPSHKPDPYALAAPGSTKKPAAADASPGAPAAAPTPAGDAPSARFSTHLTGGVHVITFSRADVLDAQYIDQLGADLKDYVTPIPTPRVVLDLDPVRFMSSAALGMLLVVRSAVEDRGGKIGLANVHPDIVQVFKITKLHKVLKIHDTTEKAVKAVSK
ncbi:MAG: STAS domain-containing protein [Planctomycetota bacterium]|jgi:anti-sigma B factor antagonist